MCGVAGYISKRGNIEASIRSKISVMNSVINYRGPDSCGVYSSNQICFGHVRLSIQDLDLRSKQPLEYNNRYIVTFNGEIYNFKTLRKNLKDKGYNFKTTSDTEVIAACYAEYGVDCASYFNGMFAIAIHDLESGESCIFRDRLGVKPLYICESDDGIWFSSEIKQLTKAKVCPLEIDELSIREYLSYQYTFEGKTFFKAIKELEPGTFLRIHSGQVFRQTYWSLDEFTVDQDKCYEKSKLELKTLLNDSVELRMTSDVKISSYLSGGIDSTLITSIAKDIEQGDFETFTFTSKKFKNDEGVIAKRTAKELKCVNHQYELNIGDFVELWKSAIYHMDEPRVGYSLIPQYQLSKFVGSKVKVILGGQGADELFYGYSWHTNLTTSLFSQLKDFGIAKRINVAFNSFLKGDIHTKLALLRGLLSFKSVSELYTAHLKSIACNGLLKKQFTDNQIAKRVGFDGTLSSIRRFELIGWLRGLLHVEDRTSMSASLESRVPFLDYKLVEFALQCPPHFFIDGIVNKKLLKETFSDKLPTRILKNKKKRGYVSPIKIWFDDPKVKLFVESVFKNRESFIYKFIPFIDDYTKLSHRQIWLLVSLEIWFDQTFSGDQIDK
ncbi:asparagine synthase (glutamine-hydrolyzing) [Pseudoalteromonas xiamenensis]